MNFNSFSSVFLFITLFFIFSLCIFIPTLSEYGYTVNTYIPNNSDCVSNFDLNNSSFLWPTPGYTSITSRFGPRRSPTTGLQSYHYGLDIGAPMRCKYCRNYFWRSNFYWF